MPNKTYLIEFENHRRQRITVPDNWKVTFGPAVAGANKPTPGYNHKMPMALRFYESAEKQRAIFTDVVSFRDTSIQIEEERTNTQEKHGFVEVDGTRKATTFQATTKEWVDPDAENEASNKPLLPTDSEIFGEEE
jgi:hypothetical protein